MGNITAFHRVCHLFFRLNRIWKLQLFTLPVVAVILLTHCAAHGQSWSTPLPGMGTFSSPRVTDLNGDGIGDVVVGVNH